MQIDLLEYGGTRNVLAGIPEAFRVRLDVGTGVCVLTEEIGGLTPGAGHEVRIEAVDEPMDDDLFARPVAGVPGESGWSSVPGADLADGAEQHPQRRPAARCRAGGPAAAHASSAHPGSSAVCPHAGGQSTAASSISSNASRTSSAVTWASPNERMPGVSMTVPPAGRSNSTADDDVCRPLPILLTSPVARKASGTSRLTRVDLPTPDCPTNTLIRQASRSMQLVERRLAATSRTASRPRPA